MPDSSASIAGEDRRLRRRGFLLVCSIFLLDGLLRTSYLHFGARATGSVRPFADTLVSELSSSVAMVIVFFGVVVYASRRWPLRGRHLVRHFPAHLGALVVYSVAKTLLMWLMRAAAWPILGLGIYDYGNLVYRFPMEFSSDVFGYAVLVAVVHAWDAWKALRDRALREARLEASLSEARLQALQGQLQPHFLFNTLNVISSVMYADPEQADRLVSRLSDLLRSSLSAPQRPEIALEEELHVLDEYVEIMRARFGDRLAVRMHVDPRAREARVPAFLLQPLVENSIQHGVARHAGAGVVDVQIDRDGSHLVVRVTDNGPGIAGDPEAAFGRGVGLANTRERLRHLHGSAASLELANRAPGGLCATVRLPYLRVATADSRARPAATGQRAATAGAATSTHG